MFLFTPLLGAQSDSSAQQSLLELDNGIKILIDVGWDSTFDASLLAELERHAPTIDLILLTHPTLEHMGAYAHACKHIPSFNAIPVYSTFPVSNLGRLLLQDIYLSNPKAFGFVVDTKARGRSPNASDLSPMGYLPEGEKSELPENALKLPPTPAEIDSYCGKIVTLKFSQPTPLHSAVSRVAGKLGSITITAYSAGHSLGGTIWKIQQSQESILYAVDWSLSRDNCLRGAGFLSGEDGRVQEALLRPTALVCSTRNAQISNIAGGRKKRDELLLDTIRKVAKEQGGTVLIPTDSVGRVLELAYLLEHAWRHDPTFSGKQGRGIGLHLAGRKVKRLSQVVGSMLEWMDEAVVKEFEAIAEAGAKHDRRGKNRRNDNDNDDGKSADSGNKAGPFDFLHVNLVSTPGQLAKILNANDGRGKVIIASDSSLEWGLSRDALLRVANDEKNIVVLTERGDGKTGLAGQIWNNWKSATQQQEDAIAGAIGSLSINDEVSVYTKTPLQDEELKAYERHMTAQKALSNQQLTLLGTSGLPSGMADQEEDDASSSSDDDSDSERQGKALTTSASKKISQATLMIGGAPPPQTKADIGVNILLKGERVYDFDVRGAKGRNRMFPFQVRRKRVDEYGEVLRPDDYTRAEERADEDVPEADEQVKAEGDNRVMGKKRKWQDSEKSRHSSSGKGKGADIKGADSSTKRKRNRGSRGGRRRNGDNADAMSDDDYDPSGNNDGVDSDSDDSDDIDDTESTLTIPHKLHTTITHITLRLRATFIDFSGLHDQNALRLLLPLIDPKKLILTAGRPQETQHLAEFYREKAQAMNLRRAGRGGATDVFYPKRGERVNASVDTNAWTVRLTPTLARELKWQKVGALGVVHVLGQVVVAEEGTGADRGEDGAPGGKRQKMLEAAPSTSTALTPAGKPADLVLDLLPPSLLAATRSVAQPIHVGDIKLADLRRVLQAEGHTAEFRGEGTLLVDGVVVVRKTGIGNVSIEDGGGGFLGGRLGMGGNANGSGAKGTFVEVRRKVYEGLAVVAGG